MGDPEPRAPYVDEDEDGFGDGYGTVVRRPSAFDYGTVCIKDTDSLRTVDAAKMEDNLSRALQSSAFISVTEEVPLSNPMSARYL